MALDDLARAYDVIRRADMVGSRTKSFRWGTAVYAPEYPLRHDSNYLLLDSLPPEVGANAIAGEAERLQSAAGLGHRHVMMTDSASAERLVPGFAALGWETHRGLVMAHRRAPEGPIDASDVVETDAARLREVRERQILTYPWATPEVARQLLDARCLTPAPVRHFAAFVEGEPVSWVERYRVGDVVQLEALETVEAFRGRGLASRVLMRALHAAREEGATLVFLCADASDWPQHFYRRLGFDDIGRYLKFKRLVP